MSKTVPSTRSVIAGRRLETTSPTETSTARPWPSPAQQNPMLIGGENVAGLHLLAHVARNVPSTGLNPCSVNDGGARLRQQPSHAACNTRRTSSVDLRLVEMTV